MSAGTPVPEPSPDAGVQQPPVPEVQGPDGGDGQQGPTPMPEGALSPDGTATGIAPAMSEQMIREAGLAVDLPWDGPSLAPRRLRYARVAPTNAEPAEPPPAPEQ